MEIELRAISFALSSAFAEGERSNQLVPIQLTAQLAASGFASLLTLSKTLANWQKEIARMWRFTKNNGITEGFHRKMKLIQRRAYGFKNFNNYRLRVIAQCG